MSVFTNIHTQIFQLYDVLGNKISKDSDAVEFVAISPDPEASVSFSRGIVFAFRDTSTLTATKNWLSSRTQTRIRMSLQVVSKYRRCI